MSEDFAEVGLGIVDELEIVGSRFLCHSCSGVIVLVRVVDLCKGTISYLDFCLHGA